MRTEASSPLPMSLPAARGLERLRHLAPHLEQPVPLLLEPVVEPFARHLREPLEVHALAVRAGQVAPRLFARERQDRRQEPRQRAEDVVAGRLRRAAPRVVRQPRCRAGP